MTARETCMACLTPPGSAALATLLVRGPKAWEAVRKLFLPHSRSDRSLPAKAQSGQFWLGKLGTAMGDEVVVALKNAGESPSVEIHCHGGPEVLRYLQELFEAEGVDSRAWEDLNRSSAPDPFQAEACIELAKAPTLRTATILLDQYHGAFGRTISAIRMAMQDRNLAKARGFLADLIRHAPLGRHLTTPWRVVLAGAPNVGKSSLANKMAGYVRSVVAPTPGTTRDIVTTCLALDGWPVELADTAGLREDTGSLEAQGITLARSAAAQADLCLWILDSSCPPVWPPSISAKLQLVINKVDLPPVWNLGLAGDSARVSAQTGEGIAALCSRVARWLVPDLPDAGSAVPFTPSLCDLLGKVQQLVDDGNFQGVDGLLVCLRTE